MDYLNNFDILITDYSSIYFDYMDKLNIKRPSVSARATGFIPEMIELVDSIIKKGYAYVTNQGNVYFSVRKYNEYGKLSGRKIENNLSGERIEIADDKEFPEDFDGDLDDLEEFEGGEE